MSLKSTIEKTLEKLLAKPLQKLARWIEKQNAEADAARQAEQTSSAAQEKEADAHEPDAVAPPSGSATPAHAATSSKYPFGLASCWAGANASKRMMNVLSPKMSDSTFRDRLKHMTDRGCDVAHLILANTADGEAGGYAAWKDADLARMKERWNAVKAAGLRPIPWLVTDDSAELAQDLFGHAGKYVKKMADAGFFADVPLVVLGLEMNEKYGSDSGWKSLRAALREHYSGPVGVHHKSGNDFPYAKYGEVVLGQLNPGCTTSQVKAQIKSILKLGKRAIGFEYSRNPDRSLCLAALEAGAEGVGNWDGGSLPGQVGVPSPSSSGESPTPTPNSNSTADDAVDYSLLQWSYGGFKGGGAKLSDKARIKNLKVSSSGLSYSWAAGGCEDLGAFSRDDYDHTVACLFVRVGGVWRGGKFDWVSTSRTSRDFKNIDDGYQGWPTNSISKADAYAFVIVGGDGKSRTNVITCGK